MKITIQLDTDNYVFKNSQDDTNIEVKRILDNVATRVAEFQHDYGSIFDVNGDLIGWFKVKENK